jgi:BirA family biotin operon repressor/biotin-[acetyl-CoA-carboxylase] ligase
MSIVRETLKGLYTHIVGRRIIHFSRVGSTMDVAAREGKAGAMEGTVVVADEQTQGRGRLQRTWVSQEGNLHLSVLLRPKAETAPLIMVVAGLVMVRAIRAATGLRARLKWPNDVMLRGRKVAGILAEGVTMQDGESYVVLGIGLNVNSDPSSVPELASIATSLSKETGTPHEKSDVLRHILQEMDYLYAQVQQGEVPWEEWRRALETLGRRVQVEWNGEVYRGLAEDVDGSGSVSVRLEDGPRITLPVGEVGYLR